MNQSSLRLAFECEGESCFKADHSISLHLEIVDVPLKRQIGDALYLPELRLHHFVSDQQKQNVMRGNSEAAR